MTVAKREAILFLFGCSEVNSTWLITSELANQRARKALFTYVVYTKTNYSLILYAEILTDGLLYHVPLLHLLYNYYCQLSY